VVTYHAAQKGTYKGQAFDDTNRWMNVFVKQEGRWQFISPCVSLPTLAPARFTREEVE
jgi:hypothetical protein